MASVGSIHTLSRSAVRVCLEQGTVSLRQASVRPFHLSGCVQEGGRARQAAAGSVASPILQPQQNCGCALASSSRYDVTPAFPEPTPRVPPPAPVHAGAARTGEEGRFFGGQPHKLGFQVRPGQSGEVHVHDLARLGVSVKMRDQALLALGALGESNGKGRWGGMGGEGEGCVWYHPGPQCGWGLQAAPTPSDRGKAHPNARPAPVPTLKNSFSSTSSTSPCP